MNKTILIGLLATLPVLAQQEPPTPNDLPMPPNAPQARHWGAAGEMPQRPSREDFHKKMLEKFDTDQDGQLSDTEKEAMKAEMQKHRGERRPGKRGHRGPRPGKAGNAPATLEL